MIKDGILADSPTEKSKILLRAEGCPYGDRQHNSSNFLLVTDGAEGFIRDVDTDDV